MGRVLPGRAYNRKADPMGSRVEFAAANERFPAGGRRFLHRRRARENPAAISNRFRAAAAAGGVPCNSRLPANQPEGNPR